MNPRNILPRAGVAKLNGKRPWRVVGDRDIPIKLKSGKPIDRGSYDNAAAANAQAFAFNAAVERNVSARAGITKRQRLAIRRADKQRQREAVEHRNVRLTVDDLGQGKFPTTTVSVNDSPAEAYAKMENAKP